MYPNGRKWAHVPWDGLCEETKVKLQEANPYSKIRDTDDADDWRRWDAYETLSGSNIVITSNEISGQFVIPEDCTIKAMYGQINVVAPGAGGGKLLQQKYFREEKR